MTAIDKTSNKYLDIEVGRCYSSNKMKIPKKISPSPILEAVTEIRFENNLPSAVVYGKLYAALSEQFDQTEQLPILEMPEQLREMQPEFKYSPHYRLKNEKFIVNIGQRSISVNRICTEHEYKNWDEYFKVIKKVFSEVQKINLVTVAERVSVRYINFLEEQSVGNILNLEIGLFNTQVTDFKELNLSFMREVSESTKLGVGIAMNAKVELKGAIKQGLIINIEAFNDGETDITKLKEVIEVLHKDAEEGFFTALNTEFLETLEPVYE